MREMKLVAIIITLVACACLTGCGTIHTLTENEYNAPQNQYWVYGVCSDGLGLCGRSSISIPAAMGPRVWNRGRSFLCCGRHCVPAVLHPEGSVGKEETGGIIELETAINGNLNHNEKKKR